MSYDLSTDKGWGETKAALADTFRKWAKEVFGSWSTKKIEWDIEANTTRYVAANLSKDEKRVTLRYVHPETNERKELWTDKFGRVVDNARALYLAIEAIRLNEARGLGEVLRQNYAALPAPVRERDPFEVLGIRPDAPMEIAEAAYKALTRSAHPDAGGSTERMQELNAAIEKVRAR
ncbi:MAG: hypothetical protein RLZZ200_1656 [Pseudomonadota bacterium]|jgi:hypothetical protein